MNKQILTTILLGGAVAMAGYTIGVQAAPKEKPHIKEESLVTMEATVTAINQKTREVTLQNEAGESVTFIAGDQVRNLAQVKVGDTLSVDYMEAVEIEVLGPKEAEVGAADAAAVGRAEPGEKPAGAAIRETTVVLVIEAIDKEMQTVTLKGPAGNSKTVKVRNPDNLNKAAVGDKVRVTYTEGLAVSVTEK